MISTQASLNLREFIHTLSSHAHHEAFPVFEGTKLLGAITVWSVARVSPEKWTTTTVRDLVDKRISTVSPDCDVTEALRLLMSEHRQPMLLVVSTEGGVKGIVTKTDILQALKTRRETAQEPIDEVIPAT
jgi:CIC family chloride channel protein